MPKKKTGQRKKAEKQKLRQKEIRSKVVPLADVPSNAAMEVRSAARFSLFLLQCFVINHHQLPPRIYITSIILSSFILSVRQMPEKTEIACLLLLLSECATLAHLCAMRQSQMHAEDGRLCCPSSGCVHYRPRHGRCHL